MLFLPRNLYSAYRRASVCCFVIRGSGNSNGQQVTIRRMDVMTTKSRAHSKQMLVGNECFEGISLCIQISCVEYFSTYR